MFIQIEIDQLQEIIERHLNESGLTIAAPIELELLEKENCVKVHLETVKKGESL